MRLCLPAAVLAVSVALMCKQTSQVWKMLLGRWTEKTTCDRSPVLPGRAGGAGFVFSRILLMFLGLQVKNGYVFERGKCKGVSNTNLVNCLGVSKEVSKARVC